MVKSNYSSPTDIDPFSLERISVISNTSKIGRGIRSYEKDFSELYYKLSCKGRPYSTKHADIGLYFLFNKKKLVYIGSSKNIASRIKNHSDKVYESVSIILEQNINTNIYDLIDYESFLIRKFRPELNYNYGGHKRSINKKKVFFYANEENLDLLNNLSHKKIELLINHLISNFIRRKELIDAASHQL